MVKYLLDTNVLSELRKTNCNMRVKAFTDNIPLGDLFISALSIGEIVFGIEKLPEGKKRTELSLWLNGHVFRQFENRIIPLDTGISEEWGKMRIRAGRTLSDIDALIAATALTNHLTLVTRNTKDFTDIGGLNLMNPWE
ncbi:ribonuclease VapC [Spirochaetia bacterium]|nr:ribonuclease VapC [Spirochaetia bacterium]